MRRNRTLVMAALALAATAIALDHVRNRPSEPRLIDRATEAPVETGAYGSTVEDPEAPGYSGLPGTEAITEAGGYGVATDEEEDRFGTEAGGYGTAPGDSEYDAGND